jgi:predicted short-subunit dehydrogenase-like oxidoreductase (DUF2520 family)
VKVFVIGPGRVGTALAGALSAAGEEVLGLHGRAPYPPALGEADAVLVAVPDPEIPAVGAALAGSGRLSAGAAVLHTAGAMGPSALGAVPHAGTFHPLQTFPGGDPPPLRGVPFAIAGDARALIVGRTLAGRLGGVAIEVPEEARALYHAAAVLACGQVAALAGAAAEALARAANVSEAEALRLLAPILAQTAKNLGALGLPAAMTGPVARGDVETQRRNAHALACVRPELAAIYEALARIGRG